MIWAALFLPGAWLAHQAGPCVLCGRKSIVALAAESVCHGPFRPGAAYIHTPKTGEAHLVPIQVADIE